MTQTSDAPSRATTLSFRLVAALSGMSAPALFALVIVMITWAEYDFMRDLGFSVTDHGESAWPSGLAHGPHGWAQIVNNAVFDLLLFVFFSWLRHEFRRRRSRRVAAALLTVVACGFVLAAFPEDGPPFGEPETWAGYLHSFGFVAIVLSSITGTVATGIALRGNERWRGYAALSVIAGVASFFFFLFVLAFALEVATTLAST